MADIDTDTQSVRRSRRHQPDAFSLVMGLLFLALGGFYLAHDLTGPEVDLRWTGPAALIAIGVAGLAASVRRRPPR
ncbi:MAG: hypothetical protein QOE05_1776 [Actinomycetota bacterium]|jgi:hypothetical protein|nr:hypothetical protein [Actinomycetota bacterium]